MGTQVMTRRDMIALGAVGFAALALPAWAKDVPATAAIVDLPVGNRATKLFLWSPTRPRGVALFSHGHGSWPERYAQLIAALNAEGFAVAAPVHVDSMHYADRDKFSLPAGFGERLADMAATSGYAASHMAGLPVIAVGHSFGTLTALCLGGALDYMSRFRDPRVKAVLGFSTPGKIPGLVRPTAYASVAVPVAIVTGTDDKVPGFVTDPADHLFPAQTVPTASYALNVAGADHVLVASPTFARAWPAARLFVEGYGLDDRRAVRTLGRWKAQPGDTFVVKAVA